MWKQINYNKDLEKALLEKNIDVFLSRLLAIRNISLDQVDKFIESKYGEMSHPHALNGIEEASILLCKHLKNNSKIAVIGDYDCDGIVSVTMIYELCKIFKNDCFVFLPSRFDHGYGLNENTLESFKKYLKEKCTIPDLLLVLDCGTNNRKEIEELYTFGIKDIIIIDHHLVSNMKEDNISNNANILINWHLNKDTFNEMCTCGEVFHLIRGIRWLTKKIEPIEFLSYAAIGTIADSSPLIGDNRIIVKNGLSEYALSFIRSSGLKTLINNVNIKSLNLSQDDVSFKIVPRINSTGRMKSPNLAFRLLSAKDVAIAEELIPEVNLCNNDRKKIQTIIENQALEQLKHINFENGILLKDDQWHIGVIGIVASKIVEETQKPSIIITNHNGKWKGSGRSLPNIDIKEILDRCNFMFERYGGHAGAVGCVLKEEYVEKAGKIFDSVCKDYIETLKIEKNNKITDRYYDATLKTTAVKEELAIILRDKLFPYCHNYNPEPIFKLKDVYVYGVKIKEGEGWKIMFFNVASKENNIKYGFKYFSPKFNSELEGMKVNIYFKMPQKWSDNMYEQFELTVVDIEKGEK